MKDADGMYATWLGVMVSSHWTTSDDDRTCLSVRDNCGLTAKWVSQDGWLFNSAGIKTNNATNPNRTSIKFKGGVFCYHQSDGFLLLLSIMSKVYRRKFTTDNRHKNTPSW